MVAHVGHVLAVGHVMHVDVGPLVLDLSHLVLLLHLSLGPKCHSLTLRCWNLREYYHIGRELN